MTTPREASRTQNITNNTPPNAVPIRNIGFVAHDNKRRATCHTGVTQQRRQISRAIAPMVSIQNSFLSYKS